MKKSGDVFYDITWCGVLGGTNENLMKNIIEFYFGDNRWEVLWRYAIRRFNATDNEKLFDDN